MATHEVTWSAFLREPTSVETLLDKGDVILKRRDGEPLRLARESKSDAERRALLEAARLLAAGMAAAKGAPLEKSVAERLPWTRFLPDEDRTAFVTEFLTELEACADLGEFAALGRLLTEWKNTASLYAEGLAPKLKRPVRGVGSRVKRPGH